MRGWRCKVGLHRWRQNRPRFAFDRRPMAGFQPDQLTRKCKDCKKMQLWVWALYKWMDCYLEKIE